MTLRQTIVLALLAFAVAINYIDRGILSVAADPLSRSPVGGRGGHAARSVG